MISNFEKKGNEFIKHIYQCMSICHVLDVTIIISDKDIAVGNKCVQMCFILFTRPAWKVRFTFFMLGSSDTYKISSTVWLIFSIFSLIVSTLYDSFEHFTIFRYVSFVLLVSANHAPTVVSVTISATPPGHRATITIRHRSCDSPLLGSVF